MLNERGKLRYNGDELYVKKNNSSSATTNSGSTSSNRSGNQNKEIIQFINETDENDKKKTKQQENLSKKYVNYIKNIIKPGNSKKFEKVYYSKNIDEKTKNVEECEEIKGETQEMETTSSSRDRNSG